MCPLIVSTQLFLDFLLVLSHQTEGRTAMPHPHHHPARPHAPKDGGKGKETQSAASPVTVLRYIHLQMEFKV
jgi:hypothetical protein